MTLIGGAKVKRGPEIDLKLFTASETGRVFYISIMSAHLQIREDTQATIPTAG